MGQPTIAYEAAAVRSAVFRPGPRIHLRQRIVTDEGARCEDLLAQERHSLNSDASCAVSETVALAHLLPQTSAIVAERDLVVRVGLGCEAPGTPDGAAYLACGGMHAVQVVRADVGCERRGRCARLLRVFLRGCCSSGGAASPRPSTRRRPSRPRWGRTSRGGS